MGILIQNPKINGRKIFSINIIFVDNFGKLFKLDIKILDIVENGKQKGNIVSIQFRLRGSFYWNDDVLIVFG